MKNKLIEIYLLVCHIYDMNNHLHLQENRNNLPTITIPELMTIYLFGQLNGHFKKRHIYDFICNYWAEWFPDLPSYQAFNRRLNLLESDFQTVFAYLLAHLNRHQRTRGGGGDHLIDSMPVMLAMGGKSRRAKVARSIAATGFCAVKQTHFHGVRLHLIARRQAGKLPKPTQLRLREGNVHDLTALKEQLSWLPSDMTLFADKAYVSRDFKDHLREHKQINLITPIKKPKKKHLSKDEKSYNKTVSSIRQPIESFFKWLIDKTDIQRASAVRSADALLVHCIGKLTFALLLLTF